MSLGAWFRRVLGRSSAAPIPSSGGDTSSSSHTSVANSLSSLSKEQAEAWLAALEAGRLDPPRDPHDRGAWDEYWKNQLKVGALEQGFSDQMSSDTALPGLLAGRGARTILCAGNGLSMEAISLALLGFDVTALDISTVPAAVFAAMLRDAEHPLSRIAGSRLRDDGSVSFDAGGSIDPESYPPMHRSADYPARGGGSLSFASGDLVDPEVCPGAFDVVIERKTVQWFANHERAAALSALSARLSEVGIFLSLCLDDAFPLELGGSQHRSGFFHASESWFREHGWTIWDGVPGSTLAGQVAWLIRRGTMKPRPSGQSVR